MVDMVVLDHREHAPQMPHDPGLSAVMDIAAAHNMGADPFLRPAFPLSLADGVPFGLGAVLVKPGSPFVFIFRLQIFSQRNAGALGMGDLTVLDDPAL